MKVSTRSEETPPLRRIESYLGSDHFSDSLDSDDLTIVSTIIKHLGSRVSDNLEDIKEQLLSCDESIAVAGYLEGKYEALASQRELELEVIKSELLANARTTLAARHERVTESMVSSHALQSTNYIEASHSKITSNEIYKLFKTKKKTQKRPI